MSKRPEIDMKLVLSIGVPVRYQRSDCEGFSLAPKPKPFDPAMMSRVQKSWAKRWSRS